ASGTTMSTATSEMGTTLPGYTSKTMSGVTPMNTASVRVHIYLLGTAAGGSGTFYIDQASLRYTNDDNLLSNGSFETAIGGLNGIANGWNKAVGPGITENSEVVDGGTSGSKVQKISASTIPVGGKLFLYQDVAMEGNKPYTFQAMMQIPQLTNSKVVFALSFVDASGTTLSTATSEMGTILPGYTSKTMSGVTPMNTASVRVHIYLQGTAAGGSGTFYIDQATLHYSS
uniref:hypothetical protein n=1 Tax=Paenibacillus periandrae TaxID=1761741 RepID=UPI001F089F57